MNTKDMNAVLIEYNELSSKVKHTREDSNRMAYLQTAISAIRSGATLAELDAERANSHFAKLGLPTFQRTTDVELQARGWKSFINGEKRDMTGGSIIPRLGTYTGLGNFVPTEYMPTLYAALGAYDFLFSDSVNLIKSTNGRPTTIPVIGDIEVVATTIAEATQQSSVDFSNIGQAVVGVYSFSSKRIAVSLEAFDDASEALSIVDITKQLFASRLARGIGNKLLRGSGTNEPLGLITALTNSNNPFGSMYEATVIHCQGSSGNTGGTENGNNSIGTNDLAAMIGALDSAYLASPNCYFAMNRKTLAKLNGLVDKSGQPVHLVQWNGGMPSIHGFGVKVSPSLDDIGPSLYPILFGDFSFWTTKLVMDDNVGLRVYRESPPLAESGQVGLSCFVRAGGALTYTDTNSPAPFVLLTNIS
jgi:HK97 family phage major capsid protein